MLQSDEHVHDDEVDDEDGDAEFEDVEDDDEEGGGERKDNKKSNLFSQIFSFFFPPSPCSQEEQLVLPLADLAKSAGGRETGRGEFVWTPLQRRLDCWLCRE